MKRTIFGKLIVSRERRFFLKEIIKMLRHNRDSQREYWLAILDYFIVPRINFFRLGRDGKMFFFFFASSISCPTLGSFRPVILLQAGTILSRKLTVDSVATFLPTSPLWLTVVRFDSNEHVGFVETNVSRRTHKISRSRFNFYYSIANSTLTYRKVGLYICNHF